MRILHLAAASADAPSWKSAFATPHELQEIGTAEALLEHMERSASDVVLVDAQLALQGNPTLLELFTQKFPSTPILVLVQEADSGLARKAVALGATDAIFTAHPHQVAVSVARALRDRAALEDLRASNSQLAEEKRSLNLDFEQRLEERTSRLGAAMKDLEAFSYSVSHDLRAPLRGIDGFARALAEDCGPALGDEGRRLIGVIRKETRRMGQLIDDLLDFSRAGRQQIDASAIDMTELARSAFQNIVEITPGPAAALTLGVLPPAQGDRSMLRQVFANLLGNAVKFTSRRGDAAIQISGWSEGNMNIYRISDNGVGFDPRYAHKLFGVFQRLHSQEEFEGTGVGLALVHRIIQRHEGRVWGEAKPNEGASFYFALPAIQPGKTAEG